MKFLLDTNICIYIIKQRPPQVLDKFKEYVPGKIGVSSITVAELEYGVQKSQRQEQNQQALNNFLAPLVVCAFDRPAAMVYGEIRSELESLGTPIGSLDTLIAAHALNLGITLVTNNVREFERVSGLKTANWVA
ncbi:MAG: tRNA(fMet)-specific endonuclease VapC [Chloroflexi bacterium]|nr:tRNA(fMet)-specific endonuclease VapC [Chloroflexota bacterium]